MVTVLDYLWSILLNNNCKDCFAFLICYYLYPLCVPNKPDKTIWKKRQKLCRQTCYFLYNDLSGEKTTGLSTMMEKFTRARFGNDLEFQNNVRNILNFWYENNMLYVQSDNSDKRDRFSKRRRVYFLYLIQEKR